MNLFPSPSKRILILAAMESEIAPVRNNMLIEHEEHQKKCSFYWGEYVHQKILLVKSGVGKKNCLRALKNISVNKINYIIMIGLAGAIMHHLRIGDIIVPKILKNIHYKDSCFQVNPGLFQKARQLSNQWTGVNKGICTDDLVTNNRICSRREKEILFQEYPQAAAVDMEAFYIGRYCAENNVPFLLLKAISDPYDFIFPSYYLTKEKFTISDYPQILGTLISRPREIIAAIKLRYYCRTAIKNNCGFLEKYLSIL